MPIYDTRASLAATFATHVVAPEGADAAAQFRTDGTADDVQIQAAINTAEAAGGGVVHLRAGTYAISAPLVISLAKGLTIEGEGWATILLADAGMNDNVIEFAPGAQGLWARIAHLKIDGNGANQTAGNCIYALGAIQCTFDHLWITRPWGAGIHLYQDGAGGTGHHNRVLGCLFDNGSVTNGGDGYGVHIQASDENVIQSSDFESNPLHVYDRSGLNTVSATTFVNGAGGVYVQWASGSRITGCTFDTLSSYGVKFEGDRNLVSASTFVNGGDIGVQLVGGMKYCAVVGNVLTSANGGTPYGIRLDSLSDLNTVVGNACQPQGSGWTTGAIVNNGAVTNVIASNATP